MIFCAINVILADRIAVIRFFWTDGGQELLRLEYENQFRINQAQNIPIVPLLNARSGRPDACRKAVLISIVYNRRGACRFLDEYS